DLPGPRSRPAGGTYRRRPPMSRSAALRAADVRAVFRLVGECRELGDDALAWQRHLVAGVARLTGGGGASTSKAHGSRSGRPGSRTGAGRTASTARPWSG